MQHTEKLSITLPTDMVKQIRAKVSAGGYSSNSEVIREALRGWINQEQRLAILDAAIGRGLADSEAGRVTDLETVRQNFKRKYAE